MEKHVFSEFLSCENIYNSNKRSYKDVLLGKVKNISFPPLEKYEDLTMNNYVGPTGESNWVIRNFLIAGAFPAAKSDDDTNALLNKILDANIDTFVCLQAEYNNNTYGSQYICRPYYEDILKIFKNKGKDPSSIIFEHCPIVDCKITNDETVIILAKKIVKMMEEGRKIYLHCWGGHGRTGTLVCIILHLIYKIDAVESLRRCQTYHDLRICRIYVRSPQTQIQRQQVFRIIDTLTSEKTFSETI